MASAGDRAGAAVDLHQVLWPAMNRLVALILIAAALSFVLPDQVVRELRLAAPRRDPCRDGAAVTTLRSVTAATVALGGHRGVVGGIVDANAVRGPMMEKSTENPTRRVEAVIATLTDTEAMLAIEVLQALDEERPEFWEVTR
jgi:hypothetical protein